MLSILIPVYNFDVTTLVGELHTQCLQSNVEFEIICMDDASEKHFKEANKSITSLNNISYRQLEKNTGRSRIRNLLASEAKFENLLFMDCDSEVVSGNYIRDYLLHCNTDKVMCGGRTHDSVLPPDTKKILRWKLGRKREEISAEGRNRSPYNSFMTNNFLLPKNIFIENPLDESLSGYGHEDTLFGFLLRRKRIPVVHIDNPLKHIGLEDAEEFLTKTENGINNLLLLWKQKKLMKEELNEIPLMKTYFNLRKMYLAGVFLFFFKMFSGTIRKNILSANPSLFLFDFYKLGLLSQRVAMS
jgi:glycosyltransferase involved in cell wall biosynthesis